MDDRLGLGVNIELLYCAQIFLTRTRKNSRKRPPKFVFRTPPYCLPGGELHLGKAGNEVDDKVPGALMWRGKTGYWRKALKQVFQTIKINIIISDKFLARCRLHIQKIPGNSLGGEKEETHQAPQVSYFQHKKKEEANFCFISTSSHPTPRDLKAASLAQTSWSCRVPPAPWASLVLPQFEPQTRLGIGLPGQPALAFLLLSQHHPPGLGLGRPASSRNLLKLSGPLCGGVRKVHIKDLKVSCFPHKKKRSRHSMVLESIYQVRVGPGKDSIFKTEV